MTALNAAALATLDRAGVTPAEYIAALTGGEEWYGDACGCLDDRCIGHHHDPVDDCGCFEVWLCDDALPKIEEARRVGVEWDVTCAVDCLAITWPADPWTALSRAIDMLDDALARLQ